MAAPLDSKGYYAILGISTGAALSDIKSAFRRLAIELHPDHNKAPDANATFQKLNEAYTALSDPAARAHYDTDQFAAPARQTSAQPPSEPIRCSSCGSISAQPRYVIFHIGLMPYAGATSARSATVAGRTDGLIWEASTKIGLRPQLRRIVFANLRTACGKWLWASPFERANSCGSSSKQGVTAWRTSSGSRRSAIHSANFVRRTGTYCVTTYPLESSGTQETEVAQPRDPTSSLGL